MYISRHIEDNISWLYPGSILNINLNAKLAICFMKNRPGHMDASNDTSLILDTSGNVIAINKPAAKRFGKTVKELLGANIFKEMPEMTAAQAKEAIDEVIATGKPLELVSVPAGRPLTIKLCPIRDAQGKVARIAANARDVTGNREKPSRSK